MTQARRGSGAPWLVAAVAGAVLVALLVLYFAVLRPYRAHHPVGEFSSAEKAAIAAGTTEVETLGTMSKQNFEQNYDSALKGATGAFKQDLTRLRDQAKKNIADAAITGQVTHTALAGPTQGGPAGYVILATFGRSTSDIAGLLQAPQQIAVTVVQSGGKWLVSDVRSVGIS